MVEAVAGWLEQEGVPILYETTARELIMNPDGSVGGLRAVGARNAVTDIRARAVGQPVDSLREQWEQFKEKWQR